MQVWVIPFFHTPDMEEYVRKHSPRTFYLPVLEEISTAVPKDFEEILILTHQIGLWKSHSIPNSSQILNNFRQYIARIFASISTFYSIAYPLDFPFHMGGTVQKWNDPIQMVYNQYELFIESH